MKGKQLLFVTHHDENFDEGLTYAIDLAKTMGNSIEILMVYKEDVRGQFGNGTEISTSPETKASRMPRELITEYYGRRHEDFDRKLSLINDVCRKGGVDVNVSMAATDVVAAIKDILKRNGGIGMVLLSPSITNDRDINAKTLNRLVKAASRPVVTMAKQAGTA